MNDIPEDEARDLLARPLYCDECRDWEPAKGLKGVLETSCGLLNEEGTNVKLLLDLSFRRSPKTNTIRYVFSVFKRLPRGLDRVYQLDVSQWNRPVADKHNQSHEHVGNARNPGEASWQKWTFEEVMVYFCQQTNITFRPNLHHPEVLQLKGQK